MSRVPIPSVTARPGIQAHAGFPLALAGRHSRSIAAAGLYAWFGGMKVTAYEAQGLTGLVGNSPLLSWTYSVFSVRVFSSLLGVLELSVGALIAARLIHPA
jgi:reactive chlorine resistance protein C